MTTAKDFFKNALKLCNEWEFEKAIDCYTKAIELKPDYAEAYFERAKSYQNYVNRITKFPDFEGPNEKDISDEIRYKLNNPEESAIEDYTKVIELKPDCAEAYFERACIYKYAGSSSYALLSLNIKDPKIKKYCYHKTVDSCKKALDDFKKAVEINPDYKDKFPEKDEFEYIIENCQQYSED